jgi:hypothetical protein
MPTVKPEYEFDISQYADVSDDSKEEAAIAVADFIKTEIYSYVGSGKSPVQGESFRQLSKKYAELEKGGDRTPNLELTGGMLAGLEVEGTPDGKVKVYISGDFENDKASGHNQFSGGESDTLPKRRFIPEDKQKFKSDIEKGIKELVTELGGVSMSKEEIKQTEKSLKDILKEFSNKKDIKEDDLAQAILDKFFGNLF